MGHDPVKNLVDFNSDFKHMVKFPPSSPIGGKLYLDLCLYVATESGSSFIYWKCYRETSDTFMKRGENEPRNWVKLLAEYEGEPSFDPIAAIKM